MLTHNTNNQRFEWLENGIISFIDYENQEDVIVLYHSEVPYEHRGKGIGNKLVNETLNYLEKKGQAYIPTCLFIKHIAARRIKNK